MSGPDTSVEIGRQWNSLNVVDRDRDRARATDASITKLQNSLGQDSEINLKFTRTISALARGTDRLLDDSVFVKGGTADGRILGDVTGGNWAGFHLIKGELLAPLSTPRTDGIVGPGGEYQVSFKAKWLGGSNHLNTRLYFNWLQRISTCQRGMGLPPITTRAVLKTQVLRSTV